MNDQLIPALLIALFGIAALYFVFFIFTKRRFMDTENFAGFREITPLPPIINYWLLKCFIIFSSLIVTYLGIDGVLIHL